MNKSKEKGVLKDEYDQLHSPRITDRHGGNHCGSLAIKMQLVEPS